MELKDKRVFITGATGFIGGWLAERLVTKEGAKVTALARTPAKGAWLADMGVDIVQGDITDPPSLREAMADCQLVFHSAAWVGEKGNKDEVWAVNVTGTQNVVDVALNVGVERFIHISSCAVYGSLQQHNITEETPTRKRGNIYSDSKVEAEDVVWRAYREDRLPVVLARASQVYGPRSYQFTVRPVEMIKTGKMILVDGGRHMCKPVYIDNLIDGLILCAKVEAAIGQAINLTDGVPVTWHKFLGAYGKMLNQNSFPSVPYALAWLVAWSNELRGALRGRKSSFNRGVVKTLHSNNSFSNQKAGQLLGWKPSIDLADGMKQTEIWLRTEGYL